MMEKFRVNSAPDRCDVCGKHTSILKPFGEPEKRGDFDGALLVLNYRAMYPLLEGDSQKKFKEHHTLEQVASYDEAAHLMGPSWECRDCLIMDDRAYFKTMDKSRKKTLQLLNERGS